MSSLREQISQKRVFVLASVILLTLIYYFTSLYYVRVSPTRKNLIFFHWLFGSVIDPYWIDFWQYIWQFAMALLLFLIVPMLIIKFYFKEDQKSYGWQWGDKKFNLIWTLIGIAIASAFFFFKDPEIAQEYPLTKLVLGDIPLFIVFNLVYLIYYLGFEFIYRAYLQFGLEDKKELGKKGIILIISISTVISTLVHIGKPFMEILGAVVLAGPLFGWFTLRGRSFIWPVLIFHYIMGIAQNIAPML